MCKCNCNKNIHWVTAITTGTSAVNLTVTNSTNIGNLQPFKLLISRCERANISAAPLPVTVTVNTVAVPLLNQNGVQILSNKIPRCAIGKYVSTTTATTTEGGDNATTLAVTPPYVILYNTPNRLV